MDGSHHKNGRRKDPKKRFLIGKSTTQHSRKTKNKMGGSHPKGRITDPRNARMEEMSWG
jgi:hypothetical protein